MASDIYCFEGKLGTCTVHTQITGSKDMVDIHHVELINNDGTPVELSNQGIQRIITLIQSGFVSLSYTGGWCPSGSVWGPDDVVHSCWDDD